MLQKPRSTLSSLDQTSASLTRLFQNPRSTLSSLDLCGCGLRDSEIVSLAVALASNGSLQKLDLSNNEFIKTVGWRVVATMLQSPSTGLTDLLLECNSIDDEAVFYLGSALETNECLKFINLGRCSKITSRGWQLFFVSLRRNAGLEALRLASNKSITCCREVVDSLTTFMEDSCTMKRLVVGYNGRYGHEELLAFQTFLAGQNESNSKLEYLGFKFCTDDHITIPFANNMRGNAKLKSLHVGEFSQISQNGWSAFALLTFDKSSIMATFRSNHTL